MGQSDAFDSFEANSCNKHNMLEGIKTGLEKGSFSVVPF